MHYYSRFQTSYVQFILFPGPEKIGETKIMIDFGVCLVFWEEWFTIINFRGLSVSIRTLSARVISPIDSFVLSL